MKKLSIYIFFLIIRTIGGPAPLPVEHIAGMEIEAMGTATRLMKSRMKIPNIDRLLFIGLQLC